MMNRARTSLTGACLLLFAYANALSAAVPSKPVMAGLSGPVGAPAGARVVKQLRIDRPGVYENIIVDGRWADADLVRIRTDNVVLRNCTVRFGLRDAVEVYGRNVLIENCKIHHVLAGTFRNQRDAHGITGRPRGLTVRNCEIAYVSGDCLQFDPSRKNKPYPWDNVLVERCVFVENDIGFRCRGTRGGAWATVRNCTIYSTTRPFRLEDRVRNTRVLHAAYGPKVGKRIFERAGGGSGDGFMDVGRRRATPLRPWPYDRLPVGKIVGPGQMPRPDDPAAEISPATGFDPAKSGLTLKPASGGGRSLAAELFGSKK